MGPFWDAAKAPVINDVSTNVEDPPVYLKSKHPSTLSPELQATIKKCYPDLQPLLVPGKDGAEVFSAAKKALAVLPRASIVEEADAAGGGRDRVVEVVDVTLLLRFRDDMVVRVRQDGGDVVIDVRSASRVGKGDLGKNAARIREYLAALRTELGL